MKSRVFATDKSIEKATKAAVKHEVQRVLPQIYADIEQNTAYQVMAVIMCVLEKHFSFGGKRLRALKNYVEDEFKLMEIGILGRDYTTADCCKHLKEKYAIDFSQSQYKDSRKS